MKTSVMLKVHRFLFILIGGFASLSGFARDFKYAYEGQTLTYTVIDEQSKTCKTKDGDYYMAGNNISGTLTIPEIAKDGDAEYTVTSIGSSAFNGCSSLTSVEIPKSITSIGSGAFKECIGLTSIEIPYTITSIERDVFSGCSGLTSFEIPNTVTSIDTGAFSSCTGLTSIEIPNSVTSIGWLAFSNCTGLTSFEIPNTVNSIETMTFSGCTGLTSVEIPNTVTSIGMMAFYNCHALTSIKIPDLVTSIGSSAFYGCKALTSVEIPHSITSIESDVFSGCSGLTSVEIPNSVTSIGSGACSGCTGLTSIEIPNSVTFIGSGAFSDCRGLISVKIPNSVTSIGAGAFSYCIRLRSIEIPNSVFYIGSYSFSQCLSLETISVDCKEIGNWFSGLTSIKTVKFGDNVQTIGSSAFKDCTGLTSVEISNSVTSIGAWAFTGCSDLTYIYCMSTTPPSAELYTFDKKTYQTGRLIVPQESIDVYKETEVWRYFTNIEHKILITSLSLDMQSYKTEVGSQFHLMAIVLPHNATYQILEWSSSDVNVATVDSNGLVKVLEAGKCTISARTTDGSDLSAQCVLQINSDVDCVETDEAEGVIQIFNLNGIFISNSTEDLAPGFYIVRHGNSMQKIVVK